MSLKSEAHARHVARCTHHWVLGPQGKTVHAVCKKCKGERDYTAIDLFTHSDWGHTQFGSPLVKHRYPEDEGY